MRTDLRDARKARKLSQTELADLIGKDQAYVSRLEKGAYKVNPEVARLLAKALRVPLMRVLYPS